MGMLVMHVRGVLVRVHDLTVRVTVRMLAEHRRIMNVIVMPIIVAMRVFVLGRLVHVLVPVPLRCVQIHPDGEAYGCDRRQRRGTAITERERDGCTDERRDSEHRARARRADLALCREVQAQADAAPRGAARGERRDRG